MVCVTDLMPSGTVHRTIIRQVTCEAGEIRMDALDLALRFDYGSIPPRLLAEPRAVLAALGLALVVLWCLKWVERRYVDREHCAELVFAFEAGAAIEQRIMPQFAAAGFAVHPRSAAFSDHGQLCTLQYEVRWHARRPMQKALDLVHEFGGSPGVISIEWRAIGRP